MKGFIVTWDVDSHNASTDSPLRRFVFGYETRKLGRVYRYPGLMGTEGVRYLGQSVLFVTLSVLPVVESFLASNMIDYIVRVAGIGPILPNKAERQAMMGAKDHIIAPKHVLAQIVS